MSIFDDARKAIEFQTTINSMNIPHSCGKSGCIIRAVNNELKGTICGKEISEKDAMKDVERLSKKINLIKSFKI
ncbi:MAG TPA: hypothetical protein VI790_04360 [Candidatus Nanoarchaeia archaeon]|nr:hypothetical protein [Candidatus Nanoarchaeia archaeon]